MNASDGAAIDLAAYPYRPIPFPAPSVVVDERPDGTLLLRSPIPFEQPAVATVSEWLVHWARERPDGAIFGQRDSNGEWRRISYRDMWQRVQALGSALLSMGLTAQRPLMMLSGNSIEFATVMLAADYAGVPIAPVSPAYSLMSSDFARLRGVCELVQPGAVFVQDAARFSRALPMVGLPPGRVIAAVPDRAGQVRLDDLAGGIDAAALAAAHGRITPEAIARIYFTSGSTGVPKGVPNSYRMLTASQMMSVQLRFPDPDPDRRSVYLDWLPWHHAFGGVANLNRLLRFGGTLYIDDGRPVPGQFDATVRNLRQVLPTSPSNVPAGYAMLAGELERDPELARRYFGSVESMGYGGASLPRELWERIERLAVRAVGHKIAFLTGYGSTETAAVGISFNWAADDIGNIGLPIPGCDVKLVRHDDRYEVRMRGPHVFSGYLNRPDLTAQAFDDEGFYSMGDAVRLADPQVPVKGLRFVGRLAEDFKLASGTWVRTGAVRMAIITQCSPLLRDAVICGQDRDFVAVLAWPDERACRALDPALSDLPLADLIAHPLLIDALARRLRNDHADGSSQRIERLLLMAEPASIDANEIADKGYVNQSATRNRRAALVEVLYAEPPPAQVAMRGI